MTWVSLLSHRPRTANDVPNPNPEIRESGAVTPPKTLLKSLRSSLQVPSRLLHAPVSGAATATLVRIQASAMLPTMKAMPLFSMEARTSGLRLPHGCGAWKDTCGA